MSRFLGMAAAAAVQACGVGCAWLLAAELAGFLESWAAALLQRHVERLVIVLGDDGWLQHDLGDDGLVAQGADRHHGAEAALKESVVVAAREQLAGLDRVDRFLGAVDADYLRLAVGAFKRL